MKKRAVGRGSTSILYGLPTSTRLLQSEVKRNGGRGRCAEGHTIRHVYVKRFLSIYLIDVFFIQN